MYRPESLQCRLLYRGGGGREGEENKEEEDDDDCDDDVSKLANMNQKNIW